MMGKHVGCEHGTPNSSLAARQQGNHLPSCNQIDSQVARLQSGSENVVPPDFLCVFIIVPIKVMSSSIYILEKYISRSLRIIHFDSIFHCKPSIWGTPMT